jgi:hypothetical protein
MSNFWWEKYPARWDDELEALQQNCIDYTIDEDAFKKGVCRLYLKVPVGDKVLDIEAVFPDLYPHFRFQVYTHDIALPYHQNHFTGNLCLIGRATDNWRPESDRLADSIIEQLPKVISAGESEDVDEVDSVEEHQAEPFSDYYSYEIGAGIIVDSNWPVDPRYNCGTLMIGLNSLSPCIQGAVFEVWNDNRSVLAKSDDRIKLAFSKNYLSARWIRLPKPPRIDKASDLFNYLSQCDGHKKVESFPLDGGMIQIRAALFPDQIAWRGTKKGWGWLFVCKYNKTQSLRKTTSNVTSKKQRRKRTRN